MILQPSRVSPPLPNDVKLSNFSQVIQNSFSDLFQAAHIHQVVSVAPTTRTGTVGDIYLFDDGTNIYLYIKTPRGWARSSSFTLI